MKSIEYRLTATDNFPIHIYEWLPESDIRGTVQIIHGMAEHAGRYAVFASFLTKNGFAVFANDLRGHGKTAGENPGTIGKDQKWDLLFDDLKMVSRHALKKNPGKPFFILGHSMGSFLGRKYVTDSEFKLSGALFSGTAANPGLLGLTGIIITKFLMLFNSGNSPGKLMHKLSFGPYSKHFKPGRTFFDWLTRDTNEVDKYIRDPLCGIVLSNGFFNWMLKTLMYINLKMNFEATPASLPVLLFSGSDDPVGNFGKGVMDVYNKYKKAGIKDVTVRIFDGGRHEMLNELNREEVFMFILQWLKERTEKPNLTT